MPVMPLAAGTTVDPSAFLQYGSVGLIAALATGALIWLYRKSVADRDRERTELLSQLEKANAQVQKLQDELRTLNSLVQQQTMTALQEATRAVGDAIARMRREA